MSLSAASIHPASTIAIFGLGASGLAAADLAAANGHRVVAFDEGGADAAGLPAGSAAFCGAGAGDAAHARAGDIDLVVLSPGVPPSSSGLQVFKNAGLPIISEIEFAYRHCEVPVVAITGTNGKTTTTGLAAHIFEHNGWPTVPCGNYGTPFSKTVMPGNGLRVATVEVSSFQLEAVTSFRPEVAAWLNFAPDHLDRYADVDEYRAAKMRLFEFQQPGDHAVVRHGEDLGLGASEVTTFSSDSGAESDFQLAGDGDAILYRGEEVARLSMTRLRGRHNAENLMAAMAVAHLAAGIPFSEMGQALASFEPPRHRCELVRQVDGVDYINDSKATNIHALASSLQAFASPVVLIVGGKDKGLDYAPLPPLLQGRVRQVIAIGEIAADLVAQLHSSGFQAAVAAPDLAAAVGEARGVAQAGDVVLLSPGTSSFDSFSGYADRGDCFSAAVQAL